MGLYGACNPISLLVELQVLCNLHTENKDVSPLRNKHIWDRRVKRQRVGDYTNASAACFNGS